MNNDNCAGFEYENKKNFISIVIPALNEELTIGEFVDWCKQGLESAGIKGEILIINSSSDKTEEIAKTHGARVLNFPKRGLGQAYIDALPHIQGNYVIMGDCDLTYDFRELKPFIDKMNEGYEFVMGSRLRGYIEPGAMPDLHRYFGTPLTTLILNLIYRSNYSDINCGMRAITLNALKKINLESTSWEYASEMVLKAKKYRLKTAEVPIKFYKDREGRLSHFKRRGWFEPWLAGWLNPKVMMLYASDFFLMMPGLLAILMGLLIVLLLSIAPDFLNRFGFSTHWMLFGVTSSVVGYSAIQLAIMARVIYDYNPEKTKFYKNIISYNKGVITGCSLFLTGLIILINFIFVYINSNFQLMNIYRTVILGLLFIILGFQSFTFTLIFNMILIKIKKKDILDK